MKIIITGASGFIGKNLLLNLPDSWEVIALYNKSYDFLNFISDHKIKNVFTEKINLLNRDHLKYLVQKYGNQFDGCIYLAANSDPAISVHNPLDDIESNTLTLINLLDLINIKRLLFFSSGAVYDGLVGDVNPKSHVNPLLPYAISKLASEQYIKFYKSVHKKIEEYILIRFFGAYGPFEPHRKIFNKLIKNFAFDKNESFIIRGDGENFIDAMYVEDTIQGIKNIFNSEISNVTVDFSSNQPITINQLVNRAAKLFGIDEPEIIHEGNVPEYIKFKVSCNDFNALFKFMPSISLEEGLMKFYNFLKSE